MKQVRRGAYGHIEHPLTNKAWQTTAWRTLPGYNAEFDQYAHGSTTLNDHGEEQPMRKSTRIQTTKWAIFQRMSRRCDDSHLHQSLESRGRCSKAENYHSKLAYNIALAILHEEGMHE